MSASTMQRRATALTGAVALAIAIGGCGSDDDASSPATQPTTQPTAQPTAAPTAQPNNDGADVTEFCDAFVTADQVIEILPWDDPDALPGAVAELLEPNLARIDAAAPPEIAGGAATLVGTLRNVFATGDFSAFDDPAFADAQESVFTYLGPACDMQVIEVVAVDFAFQGMPTAAAAGPTVLLMRNESEAGELHEIAIARVNDGVELSAAEILALPEEEAFALVEFVTGTSAPAGKTGGTTIDLNPGRYVAFCFIPIGSVHGDTGDGAPHVTAGMLGEFRVEA